MGTNQSLQEYLLKSLVSRGLAQILQQLHVIRKSLIVLEYAGKR